MSTAATGGNLLTGVAIGGLAGAVGGYAGSEAFGLVWRGAAADAPFSAFLAGGIAGGGSGGFAQGMGYTLANGGSWREAWRTGYRGAGYGAAIGAATAPFAYVYNLVVNKPPNLMPGGGSNNPNIVGTNNPSTPCAVGGVCSTSLNLVPTVNAIGGFHDLIGYAGIGCMSCAMNWVSMVPSAIITYGAVVNMAPAALLAFEQNKNND
jgi:hypothetical protein